MSDIQIVFDKIGKLALAAEPVADKAIRELALEIGWRSDMNLIAKVYTRSTDDTRPEPTGALLNSKYFRFHGEPDGFPGSVTRARAKRKDVKFGGSPPTADRPGVAVIAYSVEYALYIHEGATLWHGGQISPRPFLGPAVDEVRPFAQDFVRKALKEAGFGS